RLTRSGFDLTFTKPLAAASAAPQAAYSLQSFTYNYWATYGSPEVDRRTENLQGVTIAADACTVSLGISSFRKGRGYELRLEGVRSADGETVLHPEAYYTLNEHP